MDKDKPLDEFEQLIRDIWDRRSEGLPIPDLGLNREITRQEFENILLKCAFVQIINPESMGEFFEIRSIKSQSGWIILNYKNAMSASPGEALYFHGNYVTAEDDSLQRVCSGRGTMVLQIVNTAADMVRIAKEEEHWPSIHIVSGHPLMTWAIWKAAQDLQIPVSGYVPSKEDEDKYKRIQSYCSSLILQPTKAPGKQPG